MATILLASDLSSLRRELETMLAGPDVIIEEAATGPETIARVQAWRHRPRHCDLQIGAMGGMAITMELRNLESYGDVEPVPS